MSEYRTIPGDEGLPFPEMMMAQLNAGDHMLATSITTCAAEVWQSSGEHHQFAIIVEAEGRMNKLDLHKKQCMALTEEAATVLRDNLTHSLNVLHRSKEK